MNAFVYRPYITKKPTQNCLLTVLCHMSPTSGASVELAESTFQIKQKYQLLILTGGRIRISDNYCYDCQLLQIY